MIIEDSIAIAASRQHVWDLLLDLDFIAGCMPGVEEVVRVDERTFDGTMLAAVGPISGRFTFRAQIQDSEPPSQMTALLTGMDSVTRSALRATTVLKLRPIANGETELAYRADVQIQGRLAILGDMMLRSTSALMLEELTKRLRTELERRTAEPNDPSPAPA